MPTIPAVLAPSAVSMAAATYPAALAPSIEVVKKPRVGRMVHGWQVTFPPLALGQVAAADSTPALSGRSGRPPNKDTPSKFCDSFNGSASRVSAFKEQTSLFHARPEEVLHAPSVKYLTLAQGAERLLHLDAADVLQRTPLPKGAAAFSSMHIVVAAGEMATAAGRGLEESAAALGMKTCLHEWPDRSEEDPATEYAAFFKTSGDLILKGADRSSLLVFVGSTGDASELATAAILGMLPFRGVQVAFVSPKLSYVSPLQRLQTASGLFEYDASQPERMGRCPFAAIFGPLAERTFATPLAPWRPLRPPPSSEEKPAPFKIGGLELPMVTFEGGYEDGVKRLAGLLADHFGPELFPVVSVGQTVDALGYGSDILSALAELGNPGYYFAHASGETSKCSDAFGNPEMLSAVSLAKMRGKRVVVVAVGGGVNGNAMGTIAAMVGADLIEVPTTLMHYNDATTSAKKAFSLVQDGQILSKNILGTFYLPQMVFCISETFLTLASCSIHAAVGEATKTMSMLGNAKSATGQADFYNILGAGEFASDFTRIIGTVVGFEHLIVFLRDTKDLKDTVLSAGQALRAAREAGAPENELEAAASQRVQLLNKLRAEFHQGLPSSSRKEIIAFLTTLNEEVIRAKAMFLAYSDPFEKYRALLFEYAHTLGHGVEAFMNGLYRRAEACGLEFEDAFRLHGQCVGMAVVWAGEMSKALGHLDGDGYLAHQSLVYLFNRFGGFDFGPLRRLCDELDVSKEEFCEGVLKVVRRDNKRGYCHCAPGSSVDQLVRGRPGCLVRSSDPSAELRYLVEVSEDSQRTVLESAFEGSYDLSLVVNTAGELSFLPRGQERSATLGGAPEAAQALDRLLKSMYEDGEETVTGSEDNTDGPSTDDAGSTSPASWSPRLGIQDSNCDKSAVFSEGA